MREEFLEPLPAPLTDARLIMGEERIVCVIVEITADGFRVAVPGVEQYEGNPKLSLVTRTAIYPVRLVLQQAHVGGYSYRLQRVAAARSLHGPRHNHRFRTATSRYCAAGLIGVIAAGLYSIPTSNNEHMPLVSRRGLHNESLGEWSHAVAENDRVPPGISIDAALALNEPAGPEPQELDSDLQAIPVSMVSSTSISSIVPVASVHDLNHGTIHHAVNTNHVETALRTRNVPLKTLLDEGQAGRVQAATPEMISWLSGSAPSSDRLAFRMSDAAWLDLVQFELGLRELSPELSSQAVASLRQTLSAAATNPQSARNVPEDRDVFVMTCDDASIYFRRVRGKVELVRVLPVDVDKAR